MRVTVGVSGGIAAYKAAELVRALQRRGVEVHVVMTEAATRFVQPLTFAALTGHKVISSLWDEAGGGIPFGVLCEMLATYDDPDGAAARGATYLHGWITSGILTAVSA